MHYTTKYNNNDNNNHKKKKDDDYDDSNTTTTTETEAEEVMVTIIPSHGFPYYKNQMMIWFISLGVIYFGTVSIFDSVINPILQLPPSDPSLCPSSSTKEPCWRGDLFAFEITSSVALIYSAYVGLITWHYTLNSNNNDNKNKYSTPEQRLFGYIKQGHTLTAVGTTFQIFDFFISFFIPEQCNIIMLTHHLMAGLVSWYGLNNQYFHYYGVFFLGCSEISTMPLLFIDVARFFPPISNTYYDMFIGFICNPLFAITFFYYRVYSWWKVSIQLFQDCLHVLQTGKATKFRPGRNHVLYVMMFCNVLLGILQLYWFQYVIFGALKVFGLEIHPDMDYA